MGANIGRGKRVRCHRQAARQNQPLHHHCIVFPFHPLIVPLHQGGVAHVHQLKKKKKKIHFINFFPHSVVFTHITHTGEDIHAQTQRIYMHTHTTTCR